MDYEEIMDWRQSRQATVHGVAISSNLAAEHMSIILLASRLYTWPFLILGYGVDWMNSLILFSPETPIKVYYFFFFVLLLLFQEINLPKDRKVKERRENSKSKKKAIESGIK